MPLLKKGLNIAKSHLKAAAKNIVSEVVSNVMTTATNDKNQGSSGILVMSHRMLQFQKRRVNQRALSGKGFETIF